MAASAAWRHDWRLRNTPWPIGGSALSWPYQRISSWRSPQLAFVTANAAWLQARQQYRGVIIKRRWRRRRRQPVWQWQPAGSLPAGGVACIVAGQREKAGGGWQPASQPATFTQLAAAVPTSCGGSVAFAKQPMQARQYQWRLTACGSQLMAGCGVVVMTYSMQAAIQYSAIRIQPCGVVYPASSAGWPAVRLAVCGGWPVSAAIVAVSAAAAERILALRLLCLHLRDAAGYRRSGWWRCISVLLAW